MPCDICARRSKICSKLVDNTTTRCNEDQMKNHTGTLQKEAKALPSLRASHNKVRLRSTLVQRGSLLAMRHLERRFKRLLTIAFFSQIWLSLSAPVEKSSWPDLIGLSSLAPRHKDVAVTWMHVNGEID